MDRRYILMEDMLCSYPSKINHPVYQDNEVMALCQLNGLRRKLKRNEIYHTHYEAFISNFIQNGHAERVPDHDFVCFVVLVYITSQQLWSWRDGQFT